MNQQTPPLMSFRTRIPLGAGLLCLVALSGCGTYLSKSTSSGEKTEDRSAREAPASSSGKPSAQEASVYSKPVATSPMTYPARAVPKRIEASTHPQAHPQAAKEKKKESDTDSALNGYRLALIDSIEAANAGVAVSRLAGAPKEKVVLRLRVGQEGKPTITVLKAGQAPELAEAAKAAVERSAPLLPSPTPKASVVVITFLFGSDNRFKLH